MRHRRAALGLAGMLALSLLAGCYTVVYPNQAPAPDGPIIEQRSEPYVEPTVLGEFELCGYAIDAVRQIVSELWAAPDDTALVQQTIDSYSAYAKRLRDLAARADTPERRAKIEAAADAAEAYVAEVIRRKTYVEVDIEPTINAAKDAFPNCELD